MTAVIDDRALPNGAMQLIARGHADALEGADWTRHDNRLVARADPPGTVPELSASICASAMQVLTTGPLDRLGRCPGCGWLFIDTSRNGRRRW
ncbi:MAG: CGNR zinc finger domain-containing protein, partial [Jiangellaceae bacterium]